jgi:hypothetical protein
MEGRTVFGTRDQARSLNCAMLVWSRTGDGSPIRPFTPAWKLTVLVTVYVTQTPGQYAQSFLLVPVEAAMPAMPEVVWDRLTAMDTAEGADIGISLAETERQLAEKGFAIVWLTP